MRIGNTGFFKRHCGKIMRRRRQGSYRIFCGILLKDKKTSGDRHRGEEIKKGIFMNQDCDAPIGQIVTEKYAEGLYGYTQIFCYGSSFFQKQNRVK